MNPMPDHWLKATGADAFEFVTSGSRGWAAYYSSAGAKFIRIGNLDHDTITLDLRDLQHVSPPTGAEGARTRLQKNDVLISITAELGMVGLVPEDLGEAYINQHIALARPRTGWDARFLAWYFASEADGKALLRGSGRGGTKVGLGLDDIRNVAVPVAPETEQRRIADKLDTVLARVDSVNDRLARVAPLLKRFRQSVLAAATSGRLTDEWRRGSKDWSLASIDTLCSYMGDGPFGSNLKSDDYTEAGARVVRLENIGHLAFIADKLTFISSEKFQQLSRYVLQAGDLLFSSFVDEEVRVCELPASIGGQAINKADCFCLRVDESKALRRYLNYRLACRTTYGELKELVHGATRPRINLRQLRSYVVEVPPIDEQQEIVRRVELLFAYADRLEARLQAAQTAASRLTPSLLAKAFRGELVPQDPSDEPASELLKRLTAQSAPAGMGTGAARPRGRKPAARKSE